jgi:3-carboxy-cis,cis-muconate cycloisomerase
MSHDRLLAPGSARAAGVADDSDVLAAMVRVELAWVRACRAVGVVDQEQLEAISHALTDWAPDVRAIAADAEQSGNPVVPLVRAVRERVGPAAAEAVHRGLTSQDVLDTALVLVSRAALVRVRDSLGSVASSLARLADAHRASVMPGRTLTQYAVPVTFGLTSARWLAGVLDAVDDVADVLPQLPVQCGGAAGTLSLVAELTADPVAAARAFAAELDLVWPGIPWHTRRRPVTRVADALVAACDAVGVIGTDVALLSRPELGEVREGAVAGRGGSSTMPHKRNPVLSVLVRAAALQAPLLGAQLHLAAAQAVDERPDGAWHSEWPSLQRLIVVAVTAADQAAELAAGLEVDTAAMRRHAEAASADLLAERGGGHEVADLSAYLGAAEAFIDAVLDRHRRGSGAGDG